MQRSLIVSVATVTIALSACRTPPVNPRTDAPKAGDQQSPFLDLHQYPRPLGLAVDDSLRKHGFTRPWVVVAGSDGSVWFVAERIHSEHRFDRIQLRVTTGRHAAATITPYQFGPSYWAILGGSLVPNLHSEGDSIAEEIARKLKDEPSAVK